jgi:hypothetical protein
MKNWECNMNCYEFLHTHVVSSIIFVYNFSVSEQMHIQFQYKKCKEWYKVLSEVRVECECNASNCLQYALNSEWPFYSK